MRVQQISDLPGAGIEIAVSEASPGGRLEQRRCRIGGALGADQIVQIGAHPLSLPLNLGLDGARFRPGPCELMKKNIESLDVAPISS